MNSEKVSIIIPVYKVEQYLDHCVESALRQTYPNFEVILVDDGSPDRCGAMCDDWAKRSPLVRVIHQENGGLADARNTGIDAATGEYLAFIDSDDYITPDMVQKLYDALTACNAEMSICNFLRVYEDGTLVPELENGLPIRDEVLSGLEIISKIHIPGKGWGFGWYYTMAWNKLYKKNLFSKVRFPKGKLCEDVFVAHYLFEQCNKVACISDVCYYYLLRSGSITFERSHQTHLNDAEGYLDRALFCQERGLFRAASHAYWYTAILLSKACPTKADAKELRDEFNEVLNCFRGNRSLRKFCTSKEKAQVALICCSPSLYRFVFQNSFRKKVKRAIWKLKK